MATVSDFALRIPSSLMEDVKALATQSTVVETSYVTRLKAPLG